MPIYKDEKTNKYFVTFRYTDWQGKVHQAKKRGFIKSKDAKKYEHDFLNKLSADSSTTFSNLVKIYLEDAKNRLRITTYTNKKYLIANSITPFFGDTPISDITPLIVRKWQNSLIEKNCSETYLRMLNSRLSAIFNFGVKYLGLTNNPVRLAGPIGKKYADTLNFWTFTEFKKFIAEFKDAKSLVFKTAFQVLFYTGIREGELLALTVADYDSTAKTIDWSYVNI